MSLKPLMNLRHFLLLHFSAVSSRPRASCSDELSSRFSFSANFGVRRIAGLPLPGTSHTSDPSLKMSEGGRSAGLSSLFTSGNDIAMGSVISRAEAAAFHGVPVISMYLKAHPSVDAFIQKSSKPIALAVAGAAVVAGFVSREFTF
jgi:hypothetical protein